MEFIQTELGKVNGNRKGKCSSPLMSFRLNTVPVLTPMEKQDSVYQAEMEQEIMINEDNFD